MAITKYEKSSTSVMSIRGKYIMTPLRSNEVQFAPQIWVSRSRSQCWFWCCSARSEERAPGCSLRCLSCWSPGVPGPMVGGRGGRKHPRWTGDRHLRRGIGARRWARHRVAPGVCPRSLPPWRAIGGWFGHQDRSPGRFRGRGWCRAPAPGIGSAGVCLAAKPTARSPRWARRWPPRRVLARARNRGTCRRALSGDRRVLMSSAPRCMWTPAPRASGQLKPSPRPRYPRGCTA